MVMLQLSFFFLLFMGLGRLILAFGDKVHFLLSAFVRLLVEIGASTSARLAAQSLEGRWLHQVPVRLLFRGLEAASTHYPLSGYPVPCLSPILPLVACINIGIFWGELVLYYHLFLLYLVLV